MQSSKYIIIQIIITRICSRQTPLNCGQVYILPVCRSVGNVFKLSIFMISYAKIWTTIASSPKFKSFKSTGRGIWLQLIILAKLYGDTGYVTFSSWADGGSQTGCDGKTFRKFLGKFQEKSMLTIERTEPVIMIYITNYIKWQRLKNDKEWRENSPEQGKFPANNNKNNNTNKNNNNNIVEYDSDIPFEKIINHLNEVTNKNYRHNSKKTKDKIQARWNEGYRFDDFKYVHAVKAEEWLLTDMAKFLRPETLYSNKFEGYRNQEPMKNQLGDQQRKNLIATQNWEPKDEIF